MLHIPVVLTRGSVLARLVRAAAFVAATASLAACNLQFSTGIEAKSAWSRTYKVADGATLEIREPNGRITIEAIDGTEIQVNATRVAKTCLLPTSASRSSLSSGLYSPWRNRPPQLPAGRRTYDGTR